MHTAVAGGGGVSAAHWRLQCGSSLPSSSTKLSHASRWQGIEVAEVRLTVRVRRGAVCGDGFADYGLGMQRRVEERNLL